MKTILELAETTHELLPQAAFDAPKSLVFENWNDTNRHQIGRHHVKQIYVARRVVTDAVYLASFSGPVLVNGATGNATFDGIPIKEQINPNKGGKEVSRVASVQIDTPTILIARYGLATWGHWLCELLPKIVLVEQRFPGRYKYAFPISVVNETGSGRLGNLRGSLDAYGITQDRLTGLEGSQTYSFTNMLCVTPVWSNFMIHPGAVRSMRDGLGVSAAPTKKVALLRTEPGASRNITNLAEILEVLRARDYTLREVGNMSFLDQVALFRGAESIVGVLGSGLSGLIYAPAGIKVISLAPEEFGDRFFFALLQERDGFYADVRGPVTEQAAFAIESSFSIDCHALEAAIVALG